MANGIVVSKIIYLIQLLGGCNEYLLNKLQVLQNRAARLVKKLPWDTRIQVLLDQCGWFSVKQLVECHSLLLAFIVVHDGIPAHLNKIFNPNQIGVFRTSE